MNKIIFVFALLFLNIALPVNSSYANNQITEDVLTEKGFYDADEIVLRKIFAEIDTELDDVEGGILFESGTCNSDGCLPGIPTGSTGPQGFIPTLNNVAGQVINGSNVPDLIVKFNANTIPQNELNILSEFHFAIMKVIPCEGMGCTQFSAGADFTVYSIEPEFRPDGDIKRKQFINLKDLVAGRYMFAVRAVYNQGNTVSDWSNTVSLTVADHSMTIADLPSGHLKSCLIANGINSSDLIASIERVECSGQQLDDVEVSYLIDYFTGVRYINISNNPLLTTIPGIGGLPHLKILDISENPNVDVSGIWSFGRLDALIMKNMGQSIVMPMPPHNAYYVDYRGNDFASWSSISMARRDNAFKSLNLGNTNIDDSELTTVLTAAHDVFIEGLDLRDNPSLTSISSLGLIKGLQHLNLDRTGLEGAQEITGQSGLCSLSLSNTDVESLEPIMPVQYLNLRNNNKLKRALPLHSEVIPNNAPYYRPHWTDLSGSNVLKCHNHYNYIDNAESNSGINPLTDFSIFDGQPFNPELPTCETQANAVKFQAAETCIPTKVQSIEVFEDLNTARRFIKWDKFPNHDYERWGIKSFQISAYKVQVNDNGNDEQLIKTISVDVSEKSYVDIGLEADKYEISPCTDYTCGYKRAAIAPFEQGLTKVDVVQKNWNEGLVVIEFTYNGRVFSTTNGKPDYIRIEPAFPQPNGNQNTIDLDVTTFQSSWPSPQINPADYIGNQFYVSACRDDIGCGKATSFYLEDNTNSIINPVTGITATVNETQIKLSWDGDALDDSVDYIKIRETQPELEVGAPAYLENPNQANLAEGTYTFYTEDLTSDLSLERITNGHYTFELSACKRDRENGDVCSETNSTNAEIARYGGQYEPWEIKPDRELIVRSYIPRDNWQWPSGSGGMSVNISGTMFSEVYRINFDVIKNSLNYNNAPDYYYFQRLQGHSGYHQCYEKVIDRSTEPETISYNSLTSFKVDYSLQDGVYMSSKKACYFPIKSGVWGISACNNGIGCGEVMTVNMSNDEVGYLDINDSRNEQIESVTEGIESIGAVGGPQSIMPGHYWDPNQAGTGWQFHWATHLNEKEPLNDDYGVTYDLIGYWFTYKKDFDDLSPENYVWTPTWYKSKLKHQANGDFEGALFEYQRDGNEFVKINIGTLKANLENLPETNVNITVQLNVNSSSLETQWGGSQQSSICSTSNGNNYACTFTLENYNLKMIDEGQPSYECNADFGCGNDKDHYSGVWTSDLLPIKPPPPQTTPTSFTSDVTLITSIDRDYEVSWIASFDNEGDPVWAVTESCGGNQGDPDRCPERPSNEYFISPIADDSGNNLYTVPEGFNPLGYTPETFWSGSQSPVQVIGKLGRCFSAENYKKGGIYLDIDATLDSYVAGRNITKNLGSDVSSSTDSCQDLIDGQYLSEIDKLAGLHYIGFQVNDNVTLDTTCDPNIDGYCAIRLSWYTDMDFGSITPYYNVNGGEYLHLSNLCDSNIPSDYAIKRFDCPINLPGVYKFQLRKNLYNSVGTEVIAESDQLTILECQSGICNEDYQFNFATPPSVTDHNLIRDNDSSLVGFTGGSVGVDMHGAANYSIPIYAPVSTGGLKPQLSLEYNSNSLNGIAGVGWTVGGLSSISRCLRNKEQDGISLSEHHPIALNNTDAFCLDGQKLLQVPNGINNGENEAEYRTEFESFSKIIVNATTTTEPDSFTVYLKNGEIRTYGSNGSDFNAQVKSTDGTKAVTWLLNKIADRNGNEIWFKWDNSVVGESYLKEVKYTVRGSDAAQNVISFNYEDRPDKSVKYTNTSLNNITKRLSDITTKKRKTKMSSLQNLRILDLGYQLSPLTGQSLLSSVKECVNATQCLKPIEFDYSSDGSERGFGNKVSSDEILGFDKMTDSYKPIDLNGDGRNEILYPRYGIDNLNNPEYRFIVAGNSDYINLKTNEEPCENTSGYINRSCNSDIQPTEPERNDIKANDYYVYDFDGDGKEDLFSPVKAQGINQSTWKVSYSNGEKLCQAVESGPDCKDQEDSGISWVESAGGTSFVDFNGDGRPDLLSMETAYESGYQNYVKFYNGSGTVYESYLDDLDDTVKVKDDSTNKVLITFDKSGVPLEKGDIYCYNGSGSSQGRPYSPCEDVEGGQYQNPEELPSVAEISSISPLANDFNGDGLSDLLVTYRYVFTNLACLGGGHDIENEDWNNDLMGSIDKLEDSQCWVKWYAIHTYKPTGFNSENVPTAKLEFSQMLGMSSSGWGSNIWISYDGGQTTTDYENPYLDFDWDSEVSVQDVNGDYLADIITGDGFLINNGQGFNPIINFDRYDSSYANYFTDDYNYTDVKEAFKNLTRFIDYDHDGDMDILYPGPEITDVQNVYYRLKTLEYDESTGYQFSENFVTTSIVATHKREDEHATVVRNILMDFNGDSYVDHLFIKISPGDEKHTEFGKGAWEARDKLVNISQTAENGINNESQIVYESATLPTVYARTHNGYDKDWGQSSAVFDVKSSEYLVRELKQKSPIETGDNYSSVFYHYKGMKMQGGGRGSLGFEIMSTVDKQNKVGTVTNYLQEFPYIGSPESTVKYHHGVLDLTSGKYSCTANQPDCDFLSCRGDSCEDPLLNNSDFDVLSLSVNTYEMVSPASNAGSVFTFVETSIEDKYELGIPEDGSEEEPYITTVTTMDYENTQTPSNFHGNVKTILNEVCFEMIGGSCDVLSSTFTNNVYDPQEQDVENWILGRLTSSTVTNKRFNEESGTGYLSESNTTSFDYDDATGQLIEEILNPNQSGSFYLKTRHIYDTYGNETDTLTCSKSVVNDNNCTSTYQPPVQFENPLDIFRRKQVSYDDQWNLYKDWTKEYFGNQNDNASFVQVNEVVSRDIHGNPLVTNDLINNRSTEYKYGLFGELQSSKTNTGAYSQVINDWCEVDDGNHCPSNAVMLTTKITAGSPTERIYKDAQGRVVRSQTQSLGDESNPGAWATIDTWYDSSGRNAKVSEPYFRKNSDGNRIGVSYYTQYYYDDLNRTIQTNSPSHSTGAATTTISYDGLVQTSKNAKNQKKVTHYDQSGKVVRIDQYLDNPETVYSSVSYIYGAKGNLVLMDSDNVKTRMDYDQLGRKISMNDPDKGFWLYSYDALGNIIDQTDGLGQVIYNKYDIRGRLVSKQGEFLIGSQQLYTIWNYDQDDQWGKLTNSVSITHAETAQEPWREMIEKDFTYDGFGRSSIVSTKIYDGEDGTLPSVYSEKTTYDEYGRVFQEIDASGFGTMYEYSDYGYQTHIYEAAACEDITTGTCHSINGNQYRLYYKVLALNARGDVIKDQNHDGSLTTVRNYHAENGIMDNTCMSIGTQPDCSDLTSLGVYSIQFGFDKLGNLLNKTDKYNNETFTYDELNRLETESRIVMGNTINNSYNYLPNGNIISKHGNTINYPLNGIRPHAASTYKGTTYNYDAVGNMAYSTGTVARTIDYTGLNKAYKISYYNDLSGSDHETYFQYNTSHNRYVRKDIKNGVVEKTTHYLGNVEMTRHGGVGSRESYKRYIGSLVIDLPSRKAYQSGWVYHYQLKDHLGSNHTLFTLERDGTVVDEKTYSYDSWGMRRWIDSGSEIGVDSVSQEFQMMIAVTNRGFTGHEHLDDVGIIHMNGRIYDAQLGRFLQADPFIQDPYNTQSLNRYSYVGNNPLSANDPTGYWTMDAFMDNGGRQAFSAAVGAFMSYIGVPPVITGAVTGAINGGNRGAVIGAFTVGLTQMSNTYMSGNSRLLTNATIAGAGNYYSGGKFGYGFISAGVINQASPYVQSIGGNGFGGLLMRSFANAILGGTVSELTGGKFDNGAAYGFLNQLLAESGTVTSDDTEKFDMVDSVASDFEKSGEAIVPDEIKLEGPSFDSLDDAAIALGNLYGQEGVDRQQEVQTAIVRIGKNDYRYLTPGWGPVDATIVNVEKLYDAYHDTGYSIRAWFHGHFDNNWNFSPNDFDLVYDSNKNIKRYTFMVNSKLEVRKLTNEYLHNMKRRMEVRGIKNIARMKTYYARQGLPGELL